MNIGKLILNQFLTILFVGIVGFFITTLVFYIITLFSNFKMYNKSDLLLLLYFFNVGLAVGVLLRLIQNEYFNTRYKNYINSFLAALVYVFFLAFTLGAVSVEFYFKLFLIGAVSIFLGLELGSYFKLKKILLKKESNDKISSCKK